MITPTYSTYMEVSFFAGIAGKKKEAVEVGTVEREVQAQPLLKGKKSYVHLSPAGLRVGLEPTRGHKPHI